MIAAFPQRNLLKLGPQARFVVTRYGGYNADTALAQVGGVEATAHTYFHNIPVRFSAGQNTGRR